MNLLVFTLVVYENTKCNFGAIHYWCGGYQNCINSSQPSAKTMTKFTQFTLHGRKTITPFELLQLGNEKYIQGDFSLALHTYRIGLQEVHKKLKDLKAKKYAEYQMRNRIIAALYALSLYRKAQLECDVLISLLEKSPEDSDYYKNFVGKTYIRKGGCHYFLREPKEAFESYQKAMKIVVDQKLFLKAKEFSKLVQRAKISKKNKEQPIYNLPTSASHRIAEFLDAKTICKMNFVAFAFHEIANSKSLWRSLCDRDFPNHSSSVKNWKKHYLNLLSNKTHSTWYTWTKEDPSSSSYDSIKLQLRYSNEAYIRIEKADIYFGENDTRKIIECFGDWKRREWKHSSKIIVVDGVRIHLVEQKGILLRESKHKDFLTQFIVELDCNLNGKELTVVNTFGEDVEFMKDKKLIQLPKDPELNYLSARVNQTTIEKLGLDEK